MKRFCIRKPQVQYVSRKLGSVATRVYHPKPETARTVTPLAHNLDLNSEILTNLELRQYKRYNIKTKYNVPTNTHYDFVTEETRNACVTGHPITTLHQWTSHVDTVLCNALSYPPQVFEILLAECPNLVYEHPRDRRIMLDYIFNTLLDVNYSMTDRLYTTYLEALLKMKCHVDVEATFGDISELAKGLRYRTLEEKDLTDTICHCFGLLGNTDQIWRIYDGLRRDPTFPGYRDQSFRAGIVGHVMRGEMDEATELLRTLEHHGVLRPFSVIGLASSLIRTNHPDALMSLFENRIYLEKLLLDKNFVSLYLDCLIHGDRSFLTDLTRLFQDVTFNDARVLERLVCDVLSRGFYEEGADLLVYASDIFNFTSRKDKELFEVQTLPDITENMGYDIDNILIRCELRGIRTRHAFNFDRMTVTAEEIEKYGDVGVSAEHDKLIQKLYDNVMK